VVDPVELPHFVGVRVAAVRVGSDAKVAVGLEELLDRAPLGGPEGVARAVRKRRQARDASRLRGGLLDRGGLRMAAGPERRSRRDGEERNC